MNAHYESGFTLLELLVVLSIVAVIAAFAIPQYSDYRKKAFDMRALNDLRIAALAEEAYFLDAEKYVACMNESCRTLPGIAKFSSGTDLSIALTAEGFLATAQNKKGSGKLFIWDNQNGGLQENG